MKPPFDEILILDFESRWSSKPVEWAPEAYTLSKMTTEEYIRSSLFKAFGAGFKYYGRDETPVYLTNPFLSKFFASVDWSRTAVCCHNAQFDAAILTWIYGIKPAFIFDTLSMARALRGLEVGNSAAKLADDFGLPPKGRAVYSTDGMFEPDLVTEQELANYCKHDVWLCEQFLKRLLPGYPAKELRLIDATIRMFTEPQLALDADLLKEAIDEDTALRSSLLGKLGRVDSELASDQLFAETLRAVGVEPPTKISKTTGKVAFAFAKNDALFQQIVNGDNEDAVLLCEARMKVKSTQERTRAQRFLDISGRADGLLPVPVNYYAARTGRWQAAKGSNINMQNLKRGGKLRKSIIAPPGYTIVAGDLSQIEPRVLAHLADYQELIDIFASGKDAYAQFGAGMFGIPDLNRESHPDLRQSAKNALLGCFGPATKVLTQRGWVDIVQVAQSDLLWDGEEWVTHAGVVAQGAKQALYHRGVWATSDHRILVGDEWQEWQSVRTSHTLFKQALSSATLPASVGNECKTATGLGDTTQRCSVYAEVSTHTREDVYLLERQSDVTHADCATQLHRHDTARPKRFRLKSGMLSESLRVLAGNTATINTILGCAVRAGGKGLCSAATFLKGYLPGVIRVRERRPDKRLMRKAPTNQFLQTERTGTGFSTVSAPALCAAKTQTQLCTQTMAVGASGYGPHGLNPASAFFDTFSRWTGGTSQNYSLTASTITEAMSRAICDFAHAVKMLLTSAGSRPAMSKNSSGESAPLNKKMQTYDIALAGPRSRFLVLTEDGPIIAHNCGYRLGWASFASQLLVGFLGAPPVRYDRAFMKQLGIGKAEAIAFCEGKAGADRLARMAEIPHTCTEQELLVHCVCAKTIIDRYRATSEPIVAFWGFLDKMVATVLSVPDAEPVVYKCLTFKPGQIILPNGLPIRYDNIKCTADEFGRPQYTYWNGKTDKPLHSGIVAENVTSGTARCVIGDGMLRIQPRYTCCMPVHDEAIYVVPDADVEIAIHWIKQQLIAPVAYLPGIPLDASVGAGKRYGDCK